jgi:hypothetical protein
VGDLRSAFVELAALGARTRMGYTFNFDCSHWLFDPARLAELAEEAVTVIEAPPSSPDDTEQSVVAGLEKVLNTGSLPSHLPLLFERSDTILVQRQNHAFGDAQSLLRLPGALVRVATTGQLPKWVAEDLTAHPLWAALRNSIAPGRNPLAGLFRDRPTRGLQPHKADLGRESGLVAWTPQLQVVFKVFSRSSWDAVQQWRRANAPAASMASVYVVLLRLALRQAGIQIATDTVVLYDCRRHLPAGAHVRGNFVIGRSQQFAEDPVSAGAEIAETAHSARPLVTLIAATTKSFLVPPRPQATTVSRESISVPAFVFPPRSGDLESMPWQRKDLRCLGTANAPSGPADVTAALVMISGRLSVSFTFHSNVLTEESMREAARLMEDEAGSLLAVAVASAGS